eukprot:CCRYP_007933-RA/>CCRYP_007933-RA protein AED:0.13 eAED:0.13 QI:0/0.66/0.5/1/0/0/4/1916/117
MFLNRPGIILATSIGKDVQLLLSVIFDRASATSASASRIDDETETESLELWLASLLAGMSNADECPVSSFKDIFFQGLLHLLGTVDNNLELHRANGSGLLLEALQLREPLGSSTETG